MVSQSILTTDLIKYGKSDQVLDYNIHWHNNSLDLKYDRVNYCTNECHNHFIPLFIQQQHFEVLIKKSIVHHIRCSHLHPPDSIHRKHKRLDKIQMRHIELHIHNKFRILIHTNTCNQVLLPRKPKNVKHLIRYVN